MNFVPASRRLNGRLSIADALAEAERAGRPVRVGLIGVGQMGTDIVVQIAQMRGIEIVAAAETRVERVENAVAMAGERCRKGSNCLSERCV